MSHPRVLPLFVAMLILSAIFLSVTQAQGMPHAIIGVVTGPGDAPQTNATVSLTNSRTHDIISTSTDNRGHYQADLTSMASGYQLGDVITVKASSGNLVGSSTVTVTLAPFDQCDVTVSEKPSTEDSGINWTYVYIFFIVVVLGATFAAFYVSRNS